MFLFIFVLNSESEVYEGSRVITSVVCLLHVRQHGKVKTTKMRYFDFKGILVNLELLFLIGNFVFK